MYKSEFEGKVALVTGAGRGIGKAVVEQLKSVGAVVAEVDVLFDAEPQGDLSKNKNGIHQYYTDVSSSSAVNKTVGTIESELGEIDYLVNVAGILRMSSLLNCSDEDWQKTFAVNTTGAFNICRAVANKMAPRKRGAIVAVSSNASSVPRLNMGSYAASKAATTQLIKCLGLELSASNIRCNIVSPGSTDTDMQRQLWVDGSGEQAAIDGSLESYRLGIPLKRIATPSDISGVVLFFLSSQSSHITLENIVVDGGATLGC